MGDFVSTAVSATAGGIASASAAAAGEVILFWVGIGVTVATTIFNLILDFRKKWAKTTNEIEKDEEKTNK